MDAPDAAVVGTGYVGLVTGACLAAAGARVACVDVDPQRIALIQAGTVPFHEPGLADALRQAGDRITFQTEPVPAPVILVAVGTPASPGGADLQYLHGAVDAAATYAPRDAVLAIRSTTPPGTCDAARARLSRAGRLDVQVVHAPEFLAEGTAVRDFQQPDRIVLGGPRAATDRVAALWAPIRPEAPRIHTDATTAELCKYAANTFLAARVSLINEFANLCDAVGADVRTVARVVGLDPRVGPRFLRPGPGYGGSCLPKDVQALTHAAAHVGVAMPVGQATQDTNEAQWRHVVARCQRLLEGNPTPVVAVWGIAFKPGTGDSRNAPAVRIATTLAAAGATVRVHDPVARWQGSAPGVTQATDALAAAAGAHLLVHVTEWPHYRDVVWQDLHDAMAAPVVVDARNALPWGDLVQAGLDVTGIGARPAAPATPRAAEVVP